MKKVNAPIQMLAVALLGAVTSETLEAIQEVLMGAAGDTVPIIVVSYL